MQESLFWTKNFIYSPLPKMKFSPLSQHVVFLYSYPGLYALVLPYFQIYFILLLPLFFPLSSFPPTFPPFPLFIFPQNDIGWYFPPLGRDIFQYINPC